ncbi:MAG: formimidoylglutamase [Bacteroidales bacterium]
MDLGNLKTGKTIQDTYFALCETITCLLAQKTVVILLGGSQDLTYAMYKAYAKLNQMVNLLNIDSAFDFGDPDVPMKNNSYMGKIIVDPANYLFNYTNIGYQTYMVEGEAISLMSKLYFDAYRYGFFRGEIKEAEPMIRDSDCVTIDLSAIRYSDSPANNYARPTGFTSEDACQMMHYAGLSDQVSTVGLFEYHRLLDSNEQSAKLLAEMIWCFVDGFLHRLNDHPCQNNGMNYKKYMVTLEDSDHELTFYKCKETDRWWMELPCDGRQQEKYNRHRFISCSYKDYQTALSNETPERWWAAYQRLK